MQSAHSTIGIDTTSGVVQPEGVNVDITNIELTSTELTSIEPEPLSSSAGAASPTDQPVVEQDSAVLPAVVAVAKGRGDRRSMSPPVRHD